MHRQWESQECCIFASFTSFKHTYINLTMFIGGTQGSTPADEMNACLKNSNLWAQRKNIKINYKYACPIAKR